MTWLSEGVLIHPFHSGLKPDSMTSSVIGFSHHAVIKLPIHSQLPHTYTFYIQYKYVPFSIYHILTHYTYNPNMYHIEYSRFGNWFHTTSKYNYYVNIVHKYSKLVFINSINIAYYIILHSEPVNDTVTSFLQSIREKRYSSFPAQTVQWRQRTSIM